MGTKYTTTTISGFNASPPVNNGTVSAANQLDWQKHLDKIGTPLKNLAEGINTKLLTTLDKSARSVTSNTSAAASDHDKIIEIAPSTSPAVTITLADAATMTSNYIVTVFNGSAYTTTIARSGSDTINGGVSVSVVSGGTGIFSVNAAANGYIANINVPASGGAITGDLSVSGTITGNALATGTLTASSSISGDNVTGAMVATQAEQEAGSATNKIVTPAFQQHHPGHPKGWAKLQTNGVAAGSYNVVGVTDNGPGDATVAWSVDFEATTYAVVASSVFDVAGTADTAMFPVVTNTGYDAGSTRLISVRASDGNGTDPNYINVVALGPQ